MIPRPPTSTLFPYTTLFRSYSGLQTITVYTNQVDLVRNSQLGLAELGKRGIAFSGNEYSQRVTYMFTQLNRSEEHTSELQSRPHLVCRLLLEKKKKK